MNKLIRHLKAYYFFKKYTAVYNPSIDLRDKRVAVLGAANTLFDDKNGEWIENFDIIIRVNRSPYSWKPEHFEFVGKRIDYLFHSFFENENSGGGKFNGELYSEFGIQKIINPNNNAMGCKTHLNFYKRHCEGIDTFLLDADISDKISSRFHSKIPTVGFYALASSLIAETKELYISGFSFFQTEYADNYRNELKNMDLNKRHIQEQNLHDPEMELEIFKIFLKDSPSHSILLDPFLTKLLSKE